MFGFGHFLVHHCDLRTGDPVLKDLESFWESGQDMKQFGRDGEVVIH